MLIQSFQILNTLLTDLHATSPSTAQASSNLIRCTLSAAALAALQPIINRIGLGWTHSLLAITCMLCIPLLLLERNKGMEWRRTRTSEQTQERNISD